MKLIRKFTGPNVYSSQTAVVLDFDFAEIESNRTLEISEFNRRLLELLPGLNEHFCQSEKIGDFVTRLASDLSFNHIVAHVARELMSLTGIASERHKICRAVDLANSRTVIETDTIETTRFLLEFAAEIVEDLTEGKSFNIEEKIEEAKRIHIRTELGPSGRAIVEAAEKRGIPWSRENDLSLVQLGYGKNLHFIQAAITDETSLIATEMAGDKDLAKQRLARFFIPVPDGIVVRSEEEAVAALTEIGAPVVVKPLDGRQGKGVSLDLSTADEVAKAFQLAREYSRKILVEELFEGRNYRVLIVGGKMAAASERVPCAVKGDGVHTISELVEIENQNPLRGEGHEKPLTKIKISPMMVAGMEKEGWHLESIPPAGKEVSLCGGMNLSTGGTARDVTDEVHPTIKNLCERAARVINLDVCGVDLVLKDISEPMPKEKGGIIELNAAPGLRMHAFPSVGKSRDVGGAIIEMLYPNGSDGRIPIVAITGTNGKTSVTKMTSHILTVTDLTVGTTTTTGIFIDGERIAKGDMTGPNSARTILGDKSIGVAVLETARGGIVRRGLGYDWSDVAVFTNISEDHIGQDGIKTIHDLLNIKALIADRVKTNGTLVLNADDENLQAILERDLVKSIPKKIVYFSLDNKNELVSAHLKNGGTTFFLENDSIIEANGNDSFPIVKIRDIPVTLGGSAEFQVANAMAAIAACRALDVSREQCAAQLKTFRSDADNPGRNNLYKVGDGYVLIDYGHNTDGFAAVSRMTRRWDGKTVTGIVGLPGDRENRIVEEAAQAAARGFDRLIVMEEINRRGREPGEMAELLRAAVMRENPEIKCEIVLDEIEAFSKALAEMRENEVVVHFYRQLDLILEILKQHQAVPISTFE